MKKIIAAVMLAVCLFNIGGELVLRQYFSYITDRYFNEQAAKGFYNLNDLTEIKIPVNLPGIADWAAFENISGQIQFENTSYNYVKMRMTRTAMYLMCVPNYSGTLLSAQNIIEAKHIRDISIPKKNHIPAGKITMPAKFRIAFLQFKFSSPFKFSTIIAEPAYQQVILHWPDIPEQPPKIS